MKMLIGIILMLFLLVSFIIPSSKAQVTASTDLSPFPLTIADTASVVCRGNFYIIGGYGNNSGDLRNTIFRYNVSSDSWTQLANMITPRWGPTASCSGDRIYVFNGNNGTLLNINEYYNITLNMWFSATPEPSLNLHGQGDCSATYNTDSIFVQRQNVIAKYTVSTDTWTNYLTSDDFGLFMTCGIVGDFFYVMGGNALTNKVSQWDILGTRWTNSYDFTPYVQYGGLSNVVRNGLIYYGYGFDNSNFFAKMYSYDPVAKIWIHLNDGNHPRDGVGSGILNNTIYIVGGRFHVPAFGLDYVEGYDITFGQRIFSVSAVSVILLLSACALFVAGFKWPIMWILSSIAGLVSAVLLFSDLHNVILSGVISGAFILIPIIGVYKILTEPTGAKF
jgi:Kelch motif